jgi:type IV secretory pathway VirB2 component (pilin)
MKLQASRPISPKNLQSQTSSQTKNRLALSRLGILHGRLVRAVAVIGTMMLGAVILYGVTGWLWLVVHQGLR